MPIGEGIKDSYPVQLKGGDSTGEGSPDTSGQGGEAEGTPGGDGHGIAHLTQTPFLNPKPFHQWHEIENAAKIRVNVESCMALLDNGAQINTIMPNLVKRHSLEVGPLSDLVGR